MNFCQTSFENICENNLELAKPHLTKVKKENSCWKVQYVQTLLIKLKVRLLSFNNSDKINFLAFKVKGKKHKNGFEFVLQGYFPVAIDAYASLVIALGRIIEFACNVFEWYFSRFVLAVAISSSARQFRIPAQFYFGFLWQIPLLCMRLPFCISHSINAMP